MADDLAEDWWVEEGEPEEPSKDSTSPEKTADDVSTADVKKSEQKAQKRQRDDREDGEKKQKKRKVSAGKKKKEKVASDSKKERKRITDVPEEELTKPGTAEDVHSVMTQALKERLGQAALEDLLPDAENDFFTNNSDCLSPSAYLKLILHPVWRSALKKSLYMKKLGSPCLLIITSSAIRAVELNRQIKDFLDGKCKVAKLFAKHMKVEDQKKFLSKTNCQVGIGTPGRISVLIKQGALHIESLVGVVLDWNWRDQKLKRLVDIPEVRGDLMTLLREHLLETVHGSPCKFALL
ncbi:protein CMSS1 [Aplysia californica]|uniref:Protein CMSS1 n=1 Tax=Aplysia californica TaxID=6500 RepID=A0ABM0JNF0_APLCA|nr:protein CMSS1 [Aplysia californica]